MPRKPSQTTRPGPGTAVRQARRGRGAGQELAGPDPDRCTRNDWGEGTNPERFICNNLNVPDRNIRQGLLIDQSIKNLSSDQDVDFVKKILRDLLSDPDAPSSARAAAARTLAELSGALGRHAPPPAPPARPVAQMTLAEIEAELAALDAVLAADRAPDGPDPTR